MNATKDFSNRLGLWTTKADGTEYVTKNGKNFASVWLKDGLTLPPGTTLQLYAVDQTSGKRRPAFDLMWFTSTPAQQIVSSNPVIAPTATEITDDIPF